jgi:thiosulfate/3-mercaptopyruvate sulfurtransferase
MHKTLVSTEALAGNLEEWRVFDCRHDLAKPEWGEQQYRQSHIPGAVFAHMERDLSGPKTGRNGRHPLPDPDAFAAWLGKQGLKPEEQVVCYDAANGVMASRLWWMLRWVGHEAVAVLDGGFAKWTREGRVVSAEVMTFPETAYTALLNEDAAVGVRTVHRRLGELLLVDARTPARYRGEQEPIDPVAGRIPGALNRSSGDNVLPDGVFKDRDVLKREFESALQGRHAGSAIHYCGSGVSACHNLLAAEHAGLSGGKLYAGSWSEWSADPSRPQAKGPA